MLTYSVTPLLIVIPSERDDAIRSKSLPIVWSCIHLMLSVTTCVVSSAVLWSLAGAVVIVDGVRSLSWISLAGVLRGVHLELSGLDLCSTAVGIGVFFFRGELLGEAEKLLGCSGATGVCGQSVHYIRRVGVACLGVHWLRAWSPVGV